LLLSDNWIVNPICTCGGEYKKDFCKEPRQLVVKPYCVRGRKKNLNYVENVEVDQFAPNSLARPFKSKRNFNGACGGLSITFVSVFSNEFWNNVRQK
jgi:hypothetical protein